VATEDNEISFSAGDKISHVDITISDDWWQGTLFDGTSGLFPATYVELQGTRFDPATYELQG